jgi:hypothetical protein
VNVSASLTTIASYAAAVWALSLLAYALYLLLFRRRRF